MKKVRITARQVVSYDQIHEIPDELWKKWSKWIKKDDPRAFKDAIDYIDTHDIDYGEEIDLNDVEIALVEEP